MGDDVTPTHVRISYGRYGRITFALPDHLNDPLDHTNAFTYLDGKTHWAEVWAPLPAPFDGDWRLPGIDFNHWPEAYFQVAGRRGRLLVEIRERIGDGYRQFAVGRNSNPHEFRDETPNEVIQIGEHTATVFPHEVWTSAKATPLLQHWIRHGVLPSEVTLRALNLRTDR
ncbi:hypothetical protein [Microbacterium sp.]|uniref:hypothetical protein n=1 Tax=Microbacterium sp. TaxID=51671 RepID=UPI0039E6F2C2